MSNEQTAMLLRMIARKLIEIAEHGDEVTEHSSYKWIGEEGKEPFLCFDHDTPNWETTVVEEYMLPGMIQQYAEQLEIDADTLTSK